MRTDVPLQNGEVKNGSFRAGEQFVISALHASLCGNGRCAYLEANPHLVSTVSIRTRRRRVPLDGVEPQHRQIRVTLDTGDIGQWPPVESASITPEYRRKKRRAYGANFGFTILRLHLFASHQGKPWPPIRLPTTTGGTGGLLVQPKGAGALIS